MQEEQKLPIMELTGEAVKLDYFETGDNLGFVFTDESEKRMISLSTLLYILRNIEEKKDVPRLPEYWWQQIHQVYKDVPY